MENDAYWTQISHFLQLSRNLPLALGKCGELGEVSKKSHKSKRRWDDIATEVGLEVFSPVSRQFRNLSQVSVLSLHNSRAQSH